MDSKWALSQKQQGGSKTKIDNGSIFSSFHNGVHSISITDTHEHGSVVLIHSFYGNLFY